MKKIDAKTQSLPWWKKPVSSLKGIGPKKAIEFEGLGIVTIGDLLNHFPRQGCYLDYSHVKTIRELTLDGSMQLFRGQIARIIKRRSARNMRYASVVVSMGRLLPKSFFLGPKSMPYGIWKMGMMSLSLGKSARDEPPRLSLRLSFPRSKMSIRKLRVSCRPMP
mgnify:FL=1